MKNRHLTRTAMLTLLGTAAALLLSSCSDDDSGTGPLSYLVADFFDVNTDSEGKMTTATRDDGLLFTFETPGYIKEYSRPDTTYRAALYYYPSTDEADRTIRPYRFGLVPVVRPHAEDYFGSPSKHDAARLESAWKAKALPYINISVKYMTGRLEENQQKHTFGIIDDSLTTAADGKRIQHLSLMHSQGDAPQHYTSNIYISVSTKDMEADIVRLTVHEPDGKVTKEIEL